MHMSGKRTGIGRRYCSALNIALAGSQVNAATYTASMNDTRYEITTIMGSFIENQTLSESQPWFVSSIVAVDLIRVSADDLGGTVNNGVVGPYFATPWDSRYASIGFWTFGSTMANGGPVSDNDSLVI